MNLIAAGREAEPELKTEGKPRPCNSEMKSKTKKFKFK